MILHRARVSHDYINGRSKQVLYHTMLGVCSQHNAKLLMFKCKFWIIRQFIVAQFVEDITLKQTENTFSDPK